MKILASGDHHFDQHSRLSECVRIHDFQVELARREGVGLYISTGDLYERASTPTEREAVARWLTAMAEVCPVLITKGNHCRPKDLLILAQLSTRHPIIVEESARVHYVAGAAVAAMAWPDRASLMAALPGATAQELDNQAGEALRNVFRGLGAELAQHDGPRILAGHFMVDGSVTSVGQPLIGHEMHVGLSDFALAQPQIVLAGHVHAPQHWSCGDFDVLYVGSSHRTAYGEVEEKSVTLVEFDGARLVGWRRIPTPAARMFLATDEWATGRDGSWGFVNEWVGLPEDPADLAGAEIRARWRVPSDQRDAARAAAESLRSELLARGALSVKLEEEVIATSKARAPEVAAARTLGDKLRAFWAVRGTEPGEQRAEVLVAKAVELDDELAAQGVSRSGALRWERLRLRNVGAFRGEHELDLDGVPGPLVAIVGENGAGKSTTLELLAGALYRDCPTRGTLAGLATARDAMVEVTVVNGARHVVRQHVDSISGKGEGAVFDESGAPLIDSAKVRELDAWVGAHMPAPSVLYAGQFAPQGRRGLLDLKASERKALIAEMLGVQHLEQLAKAARARAEAAKVACAETRARLAEVPVADSDALAAAVDAADVSLSARADDAKAARAALETTRATAGDVARALELYERRQAVVRRLDGLRGQRASAQARAIALGAVVEQADAIRAAVGRAQEIDAQVREAGKRPAAEAELAAARSALRALDLRAEQARAALAREAELVELADQHRRLSEALAEARAAMVGSEAALTLAQQREEGDLALAVQASRMASRAADEQRRWRAAAVGLEEARIAGTALPGMRERAVEMAAEGERLSAEIERLEGLRLEGKDRRIGGLRDGLTAIAGADDEDAPTPAWAASALAADDALAGELAAAPAAIADLRSQRAAARADADELARRIAQHERAAGRLAEMELAAAEAAAADVLLAELDAAHVAAMQAVKATKDARETAERLLAVDRSQVEIFARDVTRYASAASELASLGEVRARLTELESARDAALERVDRANAAVAALPAVEPLIAERASLGRLLAQADELAGAPAVLAEVQLQINALDAQAGEASAELARLPDVSPAKPADLAALEQAMAVAELMQGDAARALDRARAAAEANVEAVRRSTELWRELRKLDAEQADWVRLGQDLGRDGLQAAEIDAAIPEINELANQLLHDCAGPRFTVELRTDRLSADGKRTIEALDVRVLDTVGGRDALAETFSGGECVIVGEALSLALTTIACRGKGERPTLVRDESGAALSAENARAYVAMLRLAARQLDCHRVLLVSHAPEVQELCDARVRVSSGGFALQA